jgi:hypothetical protein
LRRFCRLPSGMEANQRMKFPTLPRWTGIAAVGGVLVGVAGVGGANVLLHARPVLHVASSAQECVNAPDHLATLFSDDQSTAIRISNLDYSDLRVLRVEPAATLPGMFNSLLALSSDSRRLAYVTADDELMDNAGIQYIDVGSPGTVHPLVQVHSGLAPVRPAWSPQADELAYVIGRPLSAFRAAGFEVWTVRTDGKHAPQKVTDLPLDVFAHGHSASLCFTAAGQVGLLEGVESASGPPGPSPLTGPASAARTVTPSASPSTRPGSPCGVPVFSQNDPSWQSTIMQIGGDPIGGFGCALTSTTMLLNYYGAVLSPADLNACLGSAADPIIWQTAPGCTTGKVQGGVRMDFSWDLLDSYLKQGKPVIVGLLRGQTGSHFVVVTQGGGGEADNYSITDPWDGSTTKTLGTYTNVGYNPVWVVSYEGPGKNCGRLVRSTPSVLGVHDGGVYKGGVTLTVPPGGSGSTTVQPVTGGATASPSPSPTPTPSGTPTPTPSGAPSTSASATPTPAATPTVAPPVKGRGVVHIYSGGRYTVTGEGVYMVISCSGSPPRCRIVKFTIDRTPPVITLRPLDLHAGPIHTLAFHPMGTPTGMVLDLPGQLRMGATDTLSGVARVDYSLDGSDWKQSSNDVNLYPTLAIRTVGTHSVSVRATDLAGNMSELDDQTFQVVNSTPSPSPSPSPAAAGPQSTLPPKTGPTQAPTSAPTTPPTASPTPTPVPTTPPPPFSASASVSPASATSFNCPSGVTFTFTGTITYTGSGPINVQYQWLRSDGAIQTNQTFVSFGGPGSQQVTDTWTLFPSPPATFSGWEQVEVMTSPAVLSNQANFTLTCPIIT